MKEYKRLTERRNGIVIDKCGNCKNVNNPQGCTDKKCYEIMKNRLTDLEDKIENGTLIELPCKVGDKVYVPFFKTVYSFKIVKVEIYEEQIVLIDDSNNPIFLGELGNTVFFTKAEAEQRLKELRSND